MTAIFGWLAGKLFFGGNKGALNVVPVLVLAVIAVVLAYGAGRVSKGWQVAGELKDLRAEVATLNSTVNDQRAEHEAYVKALEQAHTAALVERDAEHARQLQAQADEVAESLQRAKRTQARFDTLNNRLAEIHRESPAAGSCVSTPGSLRLLQEAAAAANGGSTPGR